MATERLKDFPVKVIPVSADIIYLGDSADSFEEKQSTISQIFTGYSPSLVSLAGLTSSADKMAYYTASNTWAITTLTSFARSLLDDTSAANAATTLGLGTGNDVVFASITVGNVGLHILDTNASHDLIIMPGSDLTADRVFTLVTGDNARTFDISAADVTVSAFMATVLDDTSASAARTTLGAQASANIKAATTANIGGGGAGPISVVVAGATTASVVVATVESSSNPVSVIAATATGTGFDVTFSADPGASCLLNYVLFIAAQ